MDKILNFKYVKDEFNWSDSILYEFLSEYYGLYDVKIELDNGEEIIIKKYNVVGNIIGEDYITIYESNGELHKIVGSVSLGNIKSLEVLF